MKRKTILIIKILQVYSLAGFDIMKFGRQVSLKCWYHTTSYKIPEDHNFRIHYHKDLKSHKML